MPIGAGVAAYTTEYSTDPNPDQKIAPETVKLLGGQFVSPLFTKIEEEGGFKINDQHDYLRKALENAANARDACREPFGKFIEWLFNV